MVDSPICSTLSGALIGVLNGVPAYRTRTCAQISEKDTFISASVITIRQRTSGLGLMAVEAESWDTNKSSPQGLLP
jgi:hypothetical protein